MPQPKSNQIEWISNLRFIALVGVIMLHASAVLLTQYGKVPLSNWLTADFFNALVRFSVPVFVMITGALNLGSDYGPLEFIKKRLTRIVTPFLFWSLIYVGYAWYNGELDFDNDAHTNTKLVLHQLKYGASYHLWYVYMLIGLYLFMPIMGRFVKAATQKEIGYFLILWLVIMLTEQPYLLRYKPVVEVRYFEGYLGYLVLGYYLANQHLKFECPQLIAGLTFVSSVLVITSGTYFLTVSKYTITTIFYEPLGPFAVCLSASLFLFIKYRAAKLPAVIILIRDFVGRYAYGIYLCHALFLYLLDLFLHIDYKLCAPVISIPVTAILCLSLSVGLIWLINKIPVVGKYIGG